MRKILYLMGVLLFLTNRLDCAPILTASITRPATKGTVYQDPNHLALGGAVVNIVGTGPFSCALQSGSLPGGLSLSEVTPSYYPDGLCVLSGTPSTGGVFNFTIQVTDGVSATANQAVSLTVFDTALEPTFSSVTATPVDFQTETITWTTNVAADSAVFYGWNAGPYQITSTTDTAGVTSHSVTLTGLRAAQGYNWAVRSCGIVGGVGVAYACAVSSDAGSSGFTVASPPSGGSPDFWVAAYGGHRVLQSYPLIVRLNYGAQNGQASLTNTYGHRVIVTGLCSFCKVHWPDQQDVFTSGGTVSTTTTTDDTLTIGGAFAGGDSTEFEILTNVGGTTPIGTTTLTITASGSTTGSDVVHALTYSMIVQTSSFVSGSPSSYPAIPLLSTWVSDMTTYGNQWCGTAFGAGETTVWYYDGQRVFNQIANYTGDTTATHGPNAAAPPGSGFGPTSVPTGQYTWTDCAEQSEEAYFAYTPPTSMAVPGYRVFPDGLYQDAVRTGETDAKIGLHSLTTNASGALGDGGNFVTSMNVRESCYQFNAKRLDYDRGGGTSLVAVQKMATSCIGTVDQIVNKDDPSDWDQAFFCGLVADALIQYDNDPLTANHSDARVADALKKMADYLMANEWIPWAGTNGEFLYNSYDPVVPLTQLRSPLQDLNLLVAPLFARLYQKTGLSIYQREGDTIWASGLNSPPGGGCCGSGMGFTGKSFSQQFRWSFDYVTYRSAPTGFYGVSTRSTMLAMAWILAILGSLFLTIIFGLLALELRKHGGVKYDRIRLQNQ